MISTDVRYRAIPWSRLLLETNAFRAQHQPQPAAQRWPRRSFVPVWGLMYQGNSRRPSIISRTSLALDTNDAFTNRALGYALLGQDKLTEAMERFQIVVRLNDHDGGARAGLDFITKHRGKRRLTMNERVTIATRGRAASGSATSGRSP